MLITEIAEHSVLRIVLVVSFLFGLLGIAAWLNYWGERSWQKKKIPLLQQFAANYPDLKIVVLGKTIFLQDAQSRLLPVLTEDKNLSLPALPEYAEPCTELQEILTSSELNSIRDWPSLVNDAIKQVSFASA